MKKSQTTHRSKNDALNDAAAIRALKVSLQRLQLQQQARLSARKRLGHRAAYDRQGYEIPL